MATNNPSYQHGRPYPMDDAPMPKTLGVKQRPVFRTRREMRPGEIKIVGKPTNPEELLQNIKASLPRTL